MENFLFFIGWLLFISTMIYFSNKSLKKKKKTLSKLKDDYLEISSNFLDSLKIAKISHAIEDDFKKKMILREYNTFPRKDLKQLNIENQTKTYGNYTKSYSAFTRRKVVKSKMGNR